MRVPGDDDVHQLEALSPTRFVDPDSGAPPRRNLLARENETWAFSQ